MTGMLASIHCVTRPESIIRQHPSNIVINMQVLLVIVSSCFFLGTECYSFLSLDLLRGKEEGVIDTSDTSTVFCSTYNKYLVADECMSVYLAKATKWKVKVVIFPLLLCVFAKFKLLFQQRLQFLTLPLGPTKPGRTKCSKVKNDFFLFQAVPFHFFWIDFSALRTFW